MDAQGGEKLDGITVVLALLMEHAYQRDQLRDDWYFLSDSTLATLKRAQGFDPLMSFEGSRLEQALRIWIQAPVQLRNAVLEANGLALMDGDMSGVHILFD